MLRLGMIKSIVRLKYVPVILFLLLVTVSVMNVVIKLPVASELKTEETKDADGRIIRIDYTDDSGRITMASDRQYATVIRTYEDSRMIMEEYLDNRGKKPGPFQDTLFYVVHTMLKGVLIQIHIMIRTGIL